MIYPHSSITFPRSVYYVCITSCNYSPFLQLSCVRATGTGKNRLPTFFRIRSTTNENPKEVTEEKILGFVTKPKPKKKNIFLRYIL